MVFWCYDRDGNRIPVDTGYYLCYDTRCGVQQHVRKNKNLEGNSGYLKPCERCGGKCFWK